MGNRLTKFVALYTAMSVMSMSFVTPVRASTAEQMTAAAQAAFGVAYAGAGVKLGIVICTATGVAPCVAGLAGLVVGAAPFYYLFGNPLTRNPAQPPSPANPVAAARSIVYLSPQIRRKNPDPVNWDDAPAGGGNPTPKQEVPGLSAAPQFQTLTTNPAIYAACPAQNGAADCLIYATDGGSVRNEYHVMAVPTSSVPYMPAFDEAGRPKNSYQTTAQTAAGYTKISYSRAWSGVTCSPGRVYDYQRNTCVLSVSPGSVQKPAGVICETYVDGQGYFNNDAQNPACADATSPKSTPAPAAANPVARIRTCGTDSNGTAYCVYSGDVTSPAVDPPSYEDAPPEETPSASNPGKFFEHDDGTTKTTVHMAPYSPTKGGFPVRSVRNSPSSGDATQGSGGGTGGVVGGGGSGTGGTGSGGGGGSCGGAGQPSCKIDDTGFQGRASDGNGLNSKVSESDNNLLSKINGMRADEQHGISWNPLAALVPVPGACESFEIPIPGYQTVPLGLCEKLAPVRQLLGWVLYVLLVFSLFEMATAPRGRER